MKHYMKDERSLVTNRDEFDEFLERIKDSNVLQYHLSSDRMRGHDSSRLREEQQSCHRSGKGTHPFEKVHRYNLCLFRCLALDRGGDVHRLEPAVKTL